MGTVFFVAPGHSATLGPHSTPRGALSASTLIYGSADEGRMSEGSERYIPVFEGLLDPDHIEKLGTSVFLFIELLRRSKGKPIVEVTYRDLQLKLGRPKKPEKGKNQYRTLEDWMKKLKTGNYISVEGKNPMVVTIKKYRTIKYGKIQPLPDLESKEGTPRNTVEPTPQESVEQGKTIPRESVETTRKSVGPGSPTPLKPCTSKPPIKYKNKREISSLKTLPDSKPKLNKKTNPDIRVAVDHYHDEFVRIHGIKPTINGAHAKIFQGLLGDGGRSLGEVMELTTGYLSLDDEKLKSKGFPVEWLPGNINGLLLKKKQSNPETEEEKVAQKRKFEKAWAKSPAGKFETEAVTP